MNADVAQGRSIVFFPAFGASDFAELSDQYHRMMWYLFPVLDNIRRIVIAVEPANAPGQLPAYLDPQIQSIVPQFASKVELIAASELDRHLAHADHILYWNSAVPMSAAGEDGAIENVDRFRDLEECQAYLFLSSKIGQSYSFRVAQSHDTFRELVARHKAPKCYIFGTGPNLSMAAGHDYSDGISIACNSMVRNLELLDRLKPPLIVAGDPIFHAGASIYAAEFRTALYAAMERYNAFFLTNQRDYRIYYAHMPAHLREQLIGAPTDWGLRMNPDPVKSFNFVACPNIFTLFLIPLANCLAREEIWIAGCDGRPLAENKYFWKHDK